MNEILAENALPGANPGDWDLKSPSDPFGHGDLSIEGFATEMSVARGQRIEFKVDTAAKAYRIDIYRLGFYQGLGARKIATVRPFAPLPQLQPSPLVDGDTGCIDCGNWAPSASWDVPSDAVSGLYLGTLRREDGHPGANHIPFVVRRDGGDADLLFQTSDMTWQAYNEYGGVSLYFGGPRGDGAAAVSYNRPFRTRSNEQGANYLFNAEYPLLRWLESNGYSVDYFAGPDVDRFGAALRDHQVFISVGHDEYWSGAQRANVEAARDAGTHLAFLSGDTMFWRVRWEPSLDPSHTDYRTLVCYKETRADRRLDPTGEWTGTWRDGRFGASSGGGRPENSVSGTMTAKAAGFSATTIHVPAAYAGHRFWRGTSVASGAVSALQPAGSLGYEWDADIDNGHRPAGLAHLSSTREEAVTCVHGQGFIVTVGSADHHLTLYRHSSSALVFSAGTVQFAWTLDSDHDTQGRVSGPADRAARQAMVNLFADMGVSAGTLMPDLVPSASSADTTPPVSAITQPATGDQLIPGRAITVAGTASDLGGVVAAVEVSVNGGVTWRPATGTEEWSYSWTPTGNGPVRLLSRAADDSGNLEVSDVGVDVVVGTAGPCPILLVVDSSFSSNPFGSYLGEILRAEGLMAYQTIELNTLIATADASAFLSSFSLILLAEMQLPPSAQDLIRAFVSAGGQLVAMRPDIAVAEIFGVRVVGERRQRPDQPLQYLAFETAEGPGRGIVSESLHHHGAADLYDPVGATPLGWLLDDLDTVSDHPAVVLHHDGAGSTVAFAFDLARDVVLARQGNPDWQNSGGDAVETDNRTTNSNVKTMCLFSRLDGRIWFEPTRVRIPQADEKQRFLANVIIDLLNTPIPRLWYLPAGHRRVIVNTGDGETYSYPTLNQPVADVAAYGGRFTSYLMRAQIPGTDGNGTVTAAQEAAWRRDGHEVGVHSYTDYVPGIPSGNYQTTAYMERAYADVASRLQTAYGHGPRSARSHTIDWVGWVDMAKIEAAHGTKLDLNFYHFWFMSSPGLRFPQDHSKACGHFTGSALTQRFCDEMGTVLPIFQQVTQWPDEFFYNNGYVPEVVFDVALAPMLADSEDTYPSVFVTNVHPAPYAQKVAPVEAFTPTKRWVQDLWRHAQDGGIPMWSAEQLLDFVEERTATRFEAVSWDGVTLTFDLLAPTGGAELSIMLRGRGLRAVTIDGTETPITKTMWKGSDHAHVTVSEQAATITAKYARVFAVTTANDFGAGTLDGLRVVDIGDGALVVDGNVSAVAASDPGWEAWAASGDLNSTATWRTVGNRLVHETNVSVATYHPMVLSAAASPTGDFSFRTRQRVTQVAGTPGSCGALGFIFGGVDATSYWEAQYAQAGLGVRIYRRHTDGSFTLAGSETHADPVTGRWYDMRLRVRKGVASIYVDDQPVLSATLADYTPGQVGVLGYQGSRSEVADMILTGGLPFPSGIYTSTIFDAGAAVEWHEVYCDVGIPAGTSINLEVRTGGVPEPDTSWSTFRSVGMLGTSIGADAQFLQYRLTLASSDELTTPWLEAAEFHYW
jgi:hypothetical protein